MSVWPKMQAFINAAWPDCAVFKRSKNERNVFRNEELNDRHTAKIYQKKIGIEIRRGTYIFLVYFKSISLQL